MLDCSTQAWEELAELAFQGISKGFPQQFAGAAVINTGKDEDWVSLIVLKVYCGILKSEFLHNLMCCSGYFQLKTFRKSWEITQK